MSLTPTTLLSETTHTLSKVDVGARCLIQKVAGSSTKQLQDMGFMEGIEVKKLNCGRTIVCMVSGVKLAVNRKLADQVIVHTH